MTAGVKNPPFLLFCTFCIQLVQNKPSKGFFPMYSRPIAIFNILQDILNELKTLSVALPFTICRNSQQGIVK